MVYTITQILTFILFIILICLVVTLITLNIYKIQDSNTNKNANYIRHGGELTIDTLIQNGLNIDQLTQLYKKYIKDIPDEEVIKIIGGAIKNNTLLNILIKILSNFIQYSNQADLIDKAESRLNGDKKNIGSAFLKLKKYLTLFII